jgi:hypothetical protein
MSKGSDNAYHAKAVNAFIHHYRTPSPIFAGAAKVSEVRASTQNGNAPVDYRKTFAGIFPNRSVVTGMSFRRESAATFPLRI